MLWPRRWRGQRASGAGARTVRAGERPRLGQGWAWQAEGGNRDVIEQRCLLFGGMEAAWRCSGDVRSTGGPAVIVC